MSPFDNSFQNEFPQVFNSPAAPDRAASSWSDRSVVCRN